jgi:hypothetical protein
VISTRQAAFLVASGQATLAAVVSIKVAALTLGVLKAMLLTKLKTVTVVVFGIAALGLGTSGVLYQARAEAAQSQKVRQSQADKDGQEKLDEVQSLRKQLKEALQQLADLTVEKAKQRKQAEEAVRDALLQVEKMREAEKATRLDAEKALYAANMHLAQDELRKKRGHDPSLPSKDDAAARMRKQYEQRRQALQAELKSLEVDEQKELANLEQQQARTKVGQQQPSKPLEAGDKLDQILERLDRMEKRLDRIERGNPGGKRE